MQHPRDYQRDRQSRLDTKLNINERREVGGPKVWAGRRLLEVMYWGPNTTDPIKDEIDRVQAACKGGIAEVGSADGIACTPAQAVLTALRSD